MPSLSIFSMPDISTVTHLLRKNTVCFDLKAALQVSKVPLTDAVDFIADNVCQAEEVMDLSNHTIHGHLFLKLINEQVFERVLQRAEEGIFWEKSNSKVYGWSVAEYVQTFRIANLDSDMDFQMIKDKLGSYGRVLSFEKNFLKYRLTQVFNGTVTVKMKMFDDCELPEFLTHKPSGEVFQIFSENGKRVCFRCTKPGHIAAFCKKKAQDPGPESKTSSWASIAASPGKEEQPAKQREGEDDNVISPPNTTMDSQVSLFDIDGDDGENFQDLPPDASGVTSQVPSVISNPDSIDLNGSSSSLDMTQDLRPKSKKLKRAQKSLTTSN